jgi:hypothetical protein
MEAAATYWDRWWNVNIVLQLDSGGTTYENGYDEPSSGTYQSTSESIDQNMS